MYQGYFWIWARHEEPKCIISATCLNQTFLTYIVYDKILANQFLQTGLASIFPAYQIFQETKSSFPAKYDSAGLEFDSAICKKDLIRHLANNATLLPPFCHPFATLLPLFYHSFAPLLSPFCHPVTTILSPFCHPVTTILPPFCHPFATFLPPLHPFFTLFPCFYHLLPNFAIFLHHE